MDILHPDLIQPENPNNAVWRYLTADKFFDLLTEKTLRLTRLDLLGDQFEASLTKGEAKRAQAMLNVLGWTGRTYDGSTLEKFRERLFASCWQIHEYESVGMWKLYIPNGLGVAIKSSYHKL